MAETTHKDPGQNLTLAMTVCLCVHCSGLRCICVAYRDYDAIEYDQAPDPVPIDPPIEDYVCVSIAGIKVCRVFCLGCGGAVEWEVKTVGHGCG